MSAATVRSAPVSSAADGACSGSTSHWTMMPPRLSRSGSQRNRFFKMMPYLPVGGMISRAATKTATAITLPGYDQVPA